MFKAILIAIIQCMKHIKLSEKVPSGSIILC